LYRSGAMTRLAAPAYERRDVLPRTPPCRIRSYGHESADLVKSHTHIRARSPSESLRSSRVSQRTR
jgi:hypothetical protein